MFKQSKIRRHAYQDELGTTTAASASAEKFPDDFFIQTLRKKKRKILQHRINLGNLPEDIAQLLILEFCNAQSIIALAQVSRRFYFGIVTESLVQKVCMNRAGLPKEVFIGRYDKNAALRKLCSRESYLKPKIDQLKFTSISLPFENYAEGESDGEDADEMSLGEARLCSDDEYVIQTAGSADIHLGDPLLNMRQPAIVRDANNLRLIGFLPHQRGGLPFIYKSQLHGKFLILFKSLKLYACHISTNLCANEIALKNANAPSSSYSRVVCECIDVESSSTECVSLRENMFSFCIRDQVFLFEITEDMFGDPLRDYRCRPTYKLTAPEPIHRTDFDRDLDVVVGVSKTFKIFIWHNVSQETCFMDEYSYPCLLRAPQTSGSSAIFVNDGFFCVMSITGKTIVFKFNGSKFVPFRELSDKSFETRATPLYSMELSFGVLFTGDSRGGGVCVWDLMNHDKEGDDSISSSPIRLGQVHETTRNIPIEPYASRGLIESASDLSKLFFADDRGTMYVWTARVPAPVRLHSRVQEAERSEIEDDGEEEENFEWELVTDFESFRDQL